MNDTKARYRVVPAKFTRCQQVADRKPRVPSVLRPSLQLPAQPELAHKGVRRAQGIALVSSHESIQQIFQVRPLTSCMIYDDGANASPHVAHGWPMPLVACCPGDETLAIVACNMERCIHETQDETSRCDRARVLDAIHLSASRQPLARQPGVPVGKCGMICLNCVSEAYGLFKLHTTAQVHTGRGTSDTFDSSLRHCARQPTAGCELQQCPAQMQMGSWQLFHLRSRYTWVPARFAAVLQGKTHSHSGSTNQSGSPLNRDRSIVKFQ